jgi:hypothetical protein
MSVMYAYARVPPESAMSFFVLIKVGMCKRKRVWAPYRSQFLRGI